MKIMPCPLNGPRNIQEFAYGGEVTAIPGPDAPDGAWADYVFFPDNRAGVVREWWMHLPTGYWFIAERNTVSDEILRTYPPDEAFGGTPEPEPKPKPKPKPKLKPKTKPKPKAEAKSETEPQTEPEPESEIATEPEPEPESEPEPETESEPEPESGP